MLTQLSLRLKWQVNAKRTTCGGQTILKMFYIIGLGLGDPKDVTVKGLEVIKACERVYLESYTSILTCGQVALVCEHRTL